MHPTHCPNCDINWYQSETIYEHFLKSNTPFEARCIASAYGDTEDSPKHFGANVIGIEIQGQYDGISQWKCTSCNTIFDRWTMEPIS
jgi:hypothetical protein